MISRHTGLSATLSSDDQPVFGSIRTMTSSPARAPEWADHRAGVDRLTASYRAIPSGRPIRLAKKTSNLFRPRQEGVSGLDTSALTGVIAVDAVTRQADVQGMCTYEDLVAATLPHGLMPYVVPQLRTITLGGAVTGLGIESSSFRFGLPHESVLEMDVLTGTGEVVTCGPDGPEQDLFRVFPNSYGTLGYATRLRIALTPIGPQVATRNVRFSTLEGAVEAIEEICRTQEWAGEPVEFLDGVMFGLDETYLVLGHSTTATGPTSDYTGQRIYYRSLRERSHDLLSAHDYLWRWDTDWFWCSRAFGAQHPVVRRVWPKRWRRSDFYHRIVRFENKHQVMAGLDRRRGRAPLERVVQDVEVPLSRTPEFLRWFAETVRMSPVWLCPMRMVTPAGPDGKRPWPLYPMEPGDLYVNVGFWGGVRREPGSQDGDINRSIEAKVSELHGHKSLYSDAYYDRETFDELYGADRYVSVKNRYDPRSRLPGLYEKVVERR